MFTCTRLLSFDFCATDMLVRLCLFSDTGNALTQMYVSINCNIVPHSSAVFKGCVTNGKAGTAGKKGKVPGGVPCTGWYQGKQHTSLCEGTSYGGKGWCGVEAPPGQSGKYNKADSAWGGCSLACPKGGVAICSCVNGVPAKGKACNKHGSKQCASCDHGYKLDDKKLCVIDCELLKINDFASVFVISYMRMKYAIYTCPVAQLLSFVLYAFGFVY